MNEAVLCFKMKLFWAFKCNVGLKNVMFGFKMDAKYSEI